MWTRAARPVGPARDGAAALNRFVDSLTEIERASADPTLVRELYRGAVAALRVQSLFLVHIPSADTEEMTRLELQMRELSDDVDGILATVRQNSQVPAELATTASLAWSDYQRITAEVLRLSRENTNVVSFDVSVHVKRPATKACLAALSALQIAVESGPQATR